MLYAAFRNSGKIHKMRFLRSIASLFQTGAMQQSFLRPQGGSAQVVCWGWGASCEVLSGISGGLHKRLLENPVVQHILYWGISYTSHFAYGFQLYRRLHLGIFVVPHISSRDFMCTAHFSKEVQLYRTGASCEVLLRISRNESVVPHKFH